MKKLTLIGGAPLSGKTTLAVEIARKESAVEMSTDTIRSLMRKFADPDNYSDGKDGAGRTVDEFYKVHNTPQSVVDSEITEGKEVEVGVITLIEANQTWDHLVLEGIALSPSFMKDVESRFTDLEVNSLVVVDNNVKRIEERITKRGLWGKKGTYPEKYIPIEVEWVVLYNQWFEDEAKKHNIEVRHI